MHSFKSNLLLSAFASAFSTFMVPNDAAGAAPEAKSSKKTVYTDVTMKKPNADGTPRVVKFAESSKVKKSLIETAEGAPIAVMFDFRNGESEQVTVEDIKAWGLADRFSLHGASQKFGDSYAGDKDVDDAFESFLEVLTVARAGKWTEEGAGGRGGSSMLLKALVELTGKTIEEVRAVLSNTTDKEKLGLKQQPQIAAIISRLEAEKAGAVDISGALGALGIATA